jgi:hypothetical protein
VTDLTDACADLERWLPALATALERDNTPTSARSRNVTASVVNPDVLHALCTLAAEVPETTRTAATLTGETWSKRPIATCLRALPRFHDRLEQLHYATATREIEHNIGHWTAITKHALGLRLPDTPIGYNCPYHPDQPYPLVAIGAEGHLTDQRTVIWQHAGIITCRHCATDWPATQWLHLGRILEAS